jgi:CRISPR-associated endonuclease/helicase Cas3
VTPLDAGGFAAFFEAIHGCAAFPWQQALAQRVLEDGRWPPLLDLPTGAGKTAAIDIAVFHLAREADKGPDRRAPVRILFVIDRRIVVDEAFRRARKIVAALRNASDGILGLVRERLTLISGDASRPLDAVRLRGGVPQERDWARSPAQPLVAVSTVDQVGSRLLFRGYGVSWRMWPVHAGLVGADALWLLDEVHLSQPLAETLEAIAAGQCPGGKALLADGPRLAPFGVVHLSATPGHAVDSSFGLTDADWADDTLGRRLTARKIASMVPAGDDLADTFVEQALRFAGLVPDTQSVTPAKKAKAAKRGKAKPSPVVHRAAVVVNRVDLARQVFQRLRNRVGADDDGQAQVILLTGRVRPLDRDRLLAQIQPLFASLERTAPDKPIILVATQTVEAGADLDVDALVTEIAPLDALRQRFGRLDRLGLRKSSRAAIVLAATSKEHLWRVRQSHGRLAQKARRRDRLRSQGVREA